MNNSIEMRARYREVSGALDQLLAGMKLTGQLLEPQSLGARCRVRLAMDDVLHQRAEQVHALEDVGLIIQRIAFHFKKDSAK